MKFDFTPELHAKLALLATQQGRNPMELVQDVLTRYLSEPAEGEEEMIESFAPLLHS